MAVRGALKIAFSSSLAIIVVLATLSPLMAAFIDRGPSGQPRFTIFHFALTLSDDLARHSIRNSLLVATLVSIFATALGLGLGRMASVGRFFGLNLLASLAIAPGSYPPLIAAIGVSAIDPLIPANWVSSWRWFALLWVELAWAVPRVMAAVMSSVSLIDRSWVDAAKLAGGKPATAFWSIGWPLARFQVVRAASEVFFLTLFEPGAPLVLGLRNTLPVKLVESALGLGSEPRAGTLAAIGLVLGLAVRGLLRGPAGAKHSPSTIAGDWTRRRAAPLSAIVAATALGLWIAFALLPIFGLAQLALAMNQPGRSGFSAMMQFCKTGEVMATFGHSLVLGLLATAVASLYAWSVGPPQSHTSWRNPSTWTLVIPPLAIGLGVILLPAQLDAVLSRFGGLGLSLSHILGTLADPFRSPWLVLIVATSLFAVPSLQREFEKARAIDVGDKHDVARTLGASTWTARLTCSPQFLRVLVSAIAFSVAASAIAAAPALILARTVNVQPIAVRIVAIAANPAERGCTATLGVLALLFPACAWLMGKVGDLRFPRFRLVRS